MAISDKNDQGIYWTKCWLLMSQGIKDSFVTNNQNTKSFFADFYQVASFTQTWISLVNIWVCVQRIVYQCLACF